MSAGKPTASSEASHGHFTGQGPSSGLYHSPQGRRRGRAPSQSNASKARDGVRPAGARDAARAK